MANTTARFDPSIVVDVQFRVARDGSIVFEFYDSDGNAEDMYETEWEFILKKQAGVTANVLRLTTGLGNISVSGDNDEKVTITLTAALSNIPAFNYYYELYRPDLKKTWFTGTCFVSNGAYNASVNQDFVTTSTDEQVVRVALSSSGTPIRVNLGIPAYNLITLGTTLQTAASDTPLDADTFNFYDAVDSILKKVSWTNIKSTLKTYFDTIYTTTSAVASQITTALSGYLTSATAASTYIAKVNAAVALTDGANITLTAIKHTLTTDEATITWADTYTGDFLSNEITFNATGATWTFPTGSKLTYINEAGTATTSTTTMTISGATSGDKMVMTRGLFGSQYYYIVKNFG